MKKRVYLPNDWISDQCSSVSRQTLTDVSLWVNEVFFYLFFLQHFESGPPVINITEKQFANCSVLANFDRRLPKDKSWVFFFVFFFVAYLEYNLQSNICRIVKTVNGVYFSFHIQTVKNISSLFICFNSKSRNSSSLRVYNIVWNKYKSKLYIMWTTETLNNIHVDFRSLHPHTPSLRHALQPNWIFRVSNTEDKNPARDYVKEEKSWFREDEIIILRLFITDKQQ